MRNLNLGLVCLGLFAVTLPATAQRWEFGAGAAGTFYNTKDITSGNASGKVGFDSGWGATAWLGNDINNYLGGEIRYMYQKNDMKLESGSVKYAFGANSHSIHYDFLLHAAPRGAKIRPFVAFGAGFRGYEGTGKEVAVQPLNNLAFLTKTTEWVPLVSVGAGIKFMPTKRLGFRAEFRDYLTPIPNKLIATGPGTKVDGWFNNFVALVGVSVLF